VKPRPRRGNGFVVAVIGHLRPVKDPLRTAYAARRLNGANIRIVQAGRALGSAEARRARAEMERNPRYRWIGELPHWKARQLLAASDLLSLTSVMEGSANVLSEALASSVPVVASKISGLIGTLGKRYPGYFRVGDTRALARLLERAASDDDFYRTLKRRCARLKPLVDPRRERAAWKSLVAELS
jgi:glycosyltransferase involved in cell wall biosynthesis